MCAAFDKGDLLYLRDEEEKRRFKEEELRDSERAQFLRMQAGSGAGPGPGSAGDPTAGNRPAPTRAAQREKPARWGPCDVPCDSCEWKTSMRLHRNRHGRPTGAPPCL